MWAVFVVGVVLLLVNGECTLLKETPDFWRNVGGYPVALRALVLVGYYPLLGFNTLLCGFFSVLLASRVPRAGAVSALGGDWRRGVVDPVGIERHAAHGEQRGERFEREGIALP